MAKMLSAAIPESPTARLLLDLATRRSTCKLALGPRTLFVYEGELVDVQEPEALSLARFLVAAGWLRDEELARAEQSARERGVELEQALGDVEGLSAEIVRGVRRAQLLDGLVRAFADEERGDELAANADPEPLASESRRGASFDLVALVFDALARRAAWGDAGLVGAQPRAKLRLQPSAEPRALSWAELGELRDEDAARSLFPRHPSAPARIAALLRAGIVDLELDPVDAADLGAEAEGEDDVITVDRRGSLEDVASVGPLRIAPLPSLLPARVAELDDPLLPLEQRLQQLESEDAPAAERANGWLDLAEGWMHHQRSYAEAARAAREAAALTPEDPEVLAIAASLTSANGAPDLAYAYALSWAAHVTEPERRTGALRASAEYARRAGLFAESREALQLACDVSPSDAHLQEQLARMIASQGDTQTAIEHARKAAELLRPAHPERARAVLSWAAQLAPANVRTWTDLAKSYVRAGQSEVAVAILARAARLQSDSALRERLRLAGVAFAELDKRHDLASELLLETLTQKPVLAEPLCANLDAAGAYAELAVIARELGAPSSGGERAQLYAHAAGARAQLPLGDSAALELLAEAFLADPLSTPIYEALRALSSKLHRPQVVGHALERALRDRLDDRPVLDASDEELEVVRALVERLEQYTSDVTETALAPLARYTASVRFELEERSVELEAAQAEGQRLLAYEQRARALEAVLRSAPPQARTEPALQLAEWCAYDPARRALARKLYEMVLDREPRREDAFHGLAELFWLEGSLSARHALLVRRARDLPRASLLIELAYTELAAGRSAAALELALRALALDDGAAEARALAWRAASLAGDRDALLRVLHELAEGADAPRRRAQIWLRIARAESDRSRASAAVRRAFELDPESGEAALALLEEADSLAQSGELTVLRKVRARIGETPELLRQLGRAAFARADAAVQHEAIEALVKLCPDDGFAARGLVALRTTGRDVAALEQAIRASLEPRRYAGPTSYIAEQGLARLAELAGLESALQIVVDASEQLGEQARPLLDWARSKLPELASHPLHGAILEQRIALARKDEQADELRTLAAFWRAQGVRWAEARSCLRLLAVAPEDDGALERLTRLYAETAEAERLEAVLLLREERAASDEERRERLFERALVRCQLRDDPVGAAELMERALQLPTLEGERQAVLQRGLGLLFRASPREAYSLLMRLAQHAEAATTRDLLEEAMLLALHELHDSSLAAQAAIQGALRHPGHSAFLLVLEQTAQSPEELDKLLVLLEDIADRAEEPSRQAELLVRAASIAEGKLRDGSRACTLLERALRAEPAPEIEEQLIEVATRLSARDGRAGRLAFDRLRDTLHVRAKFGAPLARAQALLTLARLAADIYLTRDDALRYAEAAQAALEAAPGPSGDEGSAIGSQIAAVLAQLARADSMRPLGRSAARLPRQAVRDLDSPYTAALHTAVTMRPGSAGGAQSSTSASTPPRARPSAPGALLERAPLLGSLAPPVVSLPPPEAPPDELVGALALGDARALGSLDAFLKRSPSSASATCRLLIARLRETRFHVCGLRALAALGRAAEEPGLEQTSLQALAVFDPVEAALTSARESFSPSQLESALAAARETEHAATLALLGQLAEAAAPLFRRSVGELSSPYEPLSTTAHTQLLAELGAHFGRRHEAFLVRSQQDHVGLFSVLPTHILVGDRTPSELAPLRYRLARAFERARLENVLPATLSESGAEALLIALVAAFGPPEAQRERVSRDAAALASELWRTMPSGAQKSLARALSEHEPPLDSVDVRALAQAVQLRSARTALALTQDLTIALLQLGLDGDPSAAQIGRTESAFDATLGEPLVHGLLRYAFGEPYLRSLAG